jgi:hypothetical protein
LVGGQQTDDNLVASCGHYNWRRGGQRRQASLKSAAMEAASPLS